MRDATSSNRAGIPSPTLVAAWERLGTLPAETVPLWAAHWLTHGFDGAGLVALAALSDRDVREVHDLLPEALRDVGVEPMGSTRAAAKVAFEDTAKLALDGLAGWRWVIINVRETIAQGGYASEFFEEPLASVYGMDDELSGDWGRTAADMEDAVRAACMRQLGR